MIRPSSAATLLLIMCTMHIGNAVDVDHDTRRHRRDLDDICLSNVCHEDAGCFPLAHQTYYCKCKTSFRGDGVSYCRPWDDGAPPDDEVAVPDGPVSLSITEAPVTRAFVDPAPPTWSDAIPTDLIEATQSPVSPAIAPLTAVPVMIFTEAPVTPPVSPPSKVPIVKIAFDDSHVLKGPLL